MIIITSLLSVSLHRRKHIIIHAMKWVLMRFKILYGSVLIFMLIINAYRFRGHKLENPTCLWNSRGTFLFDVVLEDTTRTIFVLIRTFARLTDGHLHWCFDPLVFEYRLLYLGQEIIVRSSYYSEFPLKHHSRSLGQKCHVSKNWPQSENQTATWLNKLLI